MSGNNFGSDTVRLGILLYIRSLYQNATAVNPAPEGQTYYGISFSTVELGPLGPPDQRKNSAVGIHAGPEKKVDLYPVKNCTLEVNIEFRFTANSTDPDTPAVMAERVMGVVQQIMYDDETLGGNIIKYDEIGNEVDLVTYADRSVQGVVKFNLLYRQTFQNVYTSDPAI